MCRFSAKNDTSTAALCLAGVRASASRVVRAVFLQLLAHVVRCSALPVRVRARAHALVVGPLVHMTCATCSAICGVSVRARRCAMRARKMRWQKTPRTLLALDGSMCWCVQTHCVAEWIRLRAAPATGGVRSLGPGARTSVLVIWLKRGCAVTNQGVASRASKIVWEGSSFLDPESLDCL